MDSGNSGSLQSSSGGDEEYDSRADLISAFINPSAAHVGPISTPQQPQPPPQHGKNSTMFDPLSNYFDPMSRPSPQNLQNPCSSFLDLDMVWSKTIRSVPNCTEINPLFASTSSFQPHFVSQNQSHVPFTSQNLAVSFTPLTENASINSTGAVAITPRASSSSDQAHVVRNSKKRSRASRRAPTTVLTTDTTNFRAMVQEFTGIPAPPFTSSSFPRSRLDLFGTPSTMRFNPLDTISQPTYLHRPFPQKVQQPPPFLSSSSPSLSFSMLSSSMVNALGTMSSGTNNTTSDSSTSASNVNYQLPSELSLLKQPRQSTNFFNMQNPILTSLLQSNPPKSPLANPELIGSKTQGPMQIPSSDSHLRMGVFDEGLGHGHGNSNLGGLPGHISSDQTALRNDNNLTSWGNGVGSDEGDQSQARSVNGNCDFSRSAGNGKVNYSASSSNFNSDKGTENVAARSEGMVETWICSSD